MSFIKRLIARFKYGTCPNCGSAVSYGVNNGTTNCPGCRKTIVIRDGEIVGTR